VLCNVRTSYINLTALEEREYMWNNTDT
jgi:hypothetical protein